MIVKRSGLARYHFSGCDNPIMSMTLRSHSSVARVESAVAEFLQQHAWLTGLRLALSGGRDSIVLLDVLSRLSCCPPCTVVYVHHGLQQAADRQAQHCAQLAQTIGWPFQVQRVRIPTHPPEGIEAAARRLRYAALAEGLNATECVLTAHHAGDQAETFLLAALKASGPDGLAGMQPLRRLGSGWLGRPLLTLASADIRAYAEFHRLHWIEDPSNADLRFDRNWLRREILPRLAERFPVEQRLAMAAALQGELREGLATSLAPLLAQLVPNPGLSKSKSTGAGAGAGAGLGEIAGVCAGSNPCESADVDPSLSEISGTGATAVLDLAQLLQQSPKLHSWLVREFLQQAGVPLPRQGPLREFLRQLSTAGALASPVLHWAGWSLRTYRGRLFLLREQDLRPASPEPLIWPAEQAVLTLPDGRRLTREQLRAAGVATGPVEIRFRQGGEIVHTAQGRRELKNLFQARGVPPWERTRVPLVWQSGQCVAVLWNATR